MWGVIKLNNSIVTDYSYSGISKTVDLLKNNVYTKLNVFDTSVKDLDQRVTETQKSFHEHTISVNEVHLYYNN